MQYFCIVLMKFFTVFSVIPSDAFLIILQYPPDTLRHSPIRLCEMVPGIQNECSRNPPTAVIFTNPPRLFLYRGQAGILCMGLPVAKGKIHFFGGMPHFTFLYIIHETREPE